MYARKIYGLGAALVILAVFAMAQQPAPTEGKLIRHVPVKQTNPSSGRKCLPATAQCAMERMAAAAGRQLPL